MVEKDRSLVAVVTGKVASTVWRNLSHRNFLGPLTRHLSSVSEPFCSKVRTPLSVMLARDFQHLRHRSILTRTLVLLLCSLKLVLVIFRLLIIGGKKPVFSGKKNRSKENNDLVPRGHSGIW